MANAFVVLEEMVSTPLVCCIFYAKDSEVILEN
jgi:hypothetical protein